MPIPHTLAASLSLEGVGLHTGQDARVELRPAPAGRGRVFVREGVEVPALADFVTDTRRGTTLGRDGVTIATVEHLLCALLVAGVDNVEIAVAGPELPALDGSARLWYEAVLQAGIRPQDGEVPIRRITGARWIEDGESHFLLTPAEELRVYAGASVPETIIDHVLVGGPLADPAVREQLVRARTYGLQWEVEALLQAGLARGGSLENAVILTHDGYLNAEVWPHEPAWHKALDLVGDLALTGGRLAGEIVALRAGHRSHLALVRYLRQEFPPEARRS